MRGTMRLRICLERRSLRELHPRKVSYIVALIFRNKTYPPVVLYIYPTTRTTTSSFFISVFYAFGAFFLGWLFCLLFM
jgi:hypothetical protein